jgi:polysaccharide pyruvyl transferase WcaK-like protein
MSTDTPRICIFGASLDTGNLGVQALGLSILAGLRRRLPHAELIVFADRAGSRPGSVELHLPGGCGPVMYEEIGASLSRKPWKPGNLYVEEALHRVGFGRFAGPVSAALTDADLILDVSGGDSFTSLYGPYRFTYSTYPKRFARLFDAPLVLMPQSYGPFEAHVEDDVRGLLRDATQVWARDRQSRERAKRYLGDRPVGLSADVAFSLPAATLAYEFIDAPTERLFESGRPLIGVNVSGLLFNDDPARVRERFGLRTDYRRLMLDLVESLLRHDRDAHVVLMPHVIVEEHRVESDCRACRTLQSILDDELRRRTTTLASPVSACRAKSLISRCAFFVGSRMHACIAALSSGVPAAAIAYSDKTAGVFDCIGFRDAVLDPRTQMTERIVPAIVNRYDRRQLDRAKLDVRLPGAIESVDRMFDSVADLAGARSLAHAA